MLTERRPVPSVWMSTDWLLPVVPTVMEPLKPPPLIDRLSRVFVAWPETSPMALNVRSSQLPLTRPPADVSVARNSILLLGDAHRIARPTLAPASFGVY